MGLSTCNICIRKIPRRRVWCPEAISNTSLSQLNEILRVYRLAAFSKTSLTNILGVYWPVVISTTSFNMILRVYWFEATLNTCQKGHSESAFV